MQKNYYLKIDGVEYKNVHLVPPIKRNFQIVDGENAGRLALSGRMVRDVIGTYYNFSFSVNRDKSDKAEYDKLYEVLSAPVPSHEIVVPYAQETITFDAYVTNGADELARIDENGNHWNALQINFIAMNPKRTPS